MFYGFPTERHLNAACESLSFRVLPSSAAVVFHLTTGPPDYLKKLAVLNSSSLSDVFRDAHQSRPVRGTTLPFAEWAGRCLVLDEGRKPGPYLYAALLKPYGSKLALLSYPASDTASDKATDEPGCPRVHIVDVNGWVAKQSPSHTVSNPGGGCGGGGSLVQCWEKGTDLDYFVTRLPSEQRLPFVVYEGPTATFPTGCYLDRPGPSSVSQRKAVSR